MQPTPNVFASWLTLWRCAPVLTLASMLGMKQSAPAGVVADLMSR